MRKKSFLVFTLLFPIVIVVISLAPTFLVSAPPENNVRVIGCLNIEDDFLNLLETQNKISANGNRFIFFRLNKPHNTIENAFWIKEQIGTGIADAILYFGDNNGSLKLYHIDRFSAKDMLRLQNLFTNVSLINSLGINESVKNNFITISPILMQPEAISASLTTFYYSFSLLVLLAFLTLFTGGTFVRSMLYEKSNGLIELYLSSCCSKELVAGKLLGLILTGLFQTAVWLIFGLIFLWNFTDLHSVASSFSIQIFYFLLGYLLYSGIFLGAGSLISNEYQAQQVTSLLSIIMIFPLLLSVEIIQRPESLLAEVLAYFPLTIAPIGILRSASGSISFFEVIVTFAILISTIYISVVVSAKLYDASILIRSGNFSLKHFFTMNGKN